MRCDECGTTGTGDWCLQCGARLGSATGEDSADVFWADDEPTRTATPVQPAGGSSFPGYPWAGGRIDQPEVPPSSPPTGHPQTATQQPSAPTWPLALGAALVVGLLVLGIGGGVLWFLTSGDDPSAVATDTTSTSTSTSSTSTSDPTTTTVTTTTTTTGTSSTTGSAADRLGDLRDESLTRLSTDGQWAVSLSAKQDGTRDDRQVTSSGSHVFRLPDILELHEGLETTYSPHTSVYLLKAEDLGSTQGPDGDRIWMTIVDPGGLSSRDDAARWCRDEFPWLSGDDLDNSCYPRQLRSP